MYKRKTATSDPIFEVSGHENYGNKGRGTVWRSVCPRGNLMMSVLGGNRMLHVLRLRSGLSSVTGIT
jgi:hypothetical protein